MNEHKCPKCEGMLMWVGNVLDGHMECPTCKTKKAEDVVFPEPKKFEDREFDDPAAYLQEWDQILRRSGRTHKAVLDLLQQMTDSGKNGLYLIPTVQMGQYVLDMAASILVNAGFAVSRMPSRNGLKFMKKDPYGPALALYVVSVYNDPRGFNRGVAFAIDHATYEIRNTVSRDSLNEWEAYHGRP